MNTSTEEESVAALNKTITRSTCWGRTKGQESETSKLEMMEMRKEISRQHVCSHAVPLERLTRLHLMEESIEGQQINAFFMNLCNKPKFHT